MVQSARLGQLPANEHDKLIIEGYYRFRSKHYGPGLTHPPTIPSLRPKGATAALDEENKAAMIYATYSICIVLVILLVGSRLMLRAFKKTLRWGPDDWVMCVAGAGAVAYIAQIMSLVKTARIGYHYWTITYANMEELTSFIGVSSPQFYLIVGLIKISICLFNSRLTGITSRKWKIYHYTLLTAIVCWMIALFFAHLFICYPIWVLLRYSNMGAATKTKTCYSPGKMQAAVSVLHVVFDMFLLPVPLVVLRRVRMSKRQRGLLIFALSLGVVCVLAAIMRAVGLLKGSSRSDPTYKYPDLDRWTLIDLMFAIAVSNLPTLNSILPKSIRGSVRSSQGSDSKPPMVSMSPHRPASKDEASDVHIVQLKHDHDEEASLSSRVETASAPSTRGGLGGPTKKRIQPDSDDYHANIKPTV